MIRLNCLITAADLVYAPQPQFLPLFEIDTPAEIAAWARRLLAQDRDSPRAVRDYAIGRDRTEDVI